MPLLFKTKKKVLDDKELLLRYQETGQVDLLGTLYQRYMHLVFGLCLKYLKDRDQSQDAVMDIFEQLTIKLLTHEVSNFKPWLYVLAKNHCLMQLRKQTTGTLPIDEAAQQKLLMESVAFEHHTDEGPELEADLHALELCIQKLRTTQRLCVELFFLQQKCYKQIAEELVLDLKKVKSYIQNGKRNLKICIEQHGQQA